MGSPARAAVPDRVSTPQSSLFDVQVNGFAGVDFQQPGLSAAAVRRAVDALAAHETARFFVTLITDEIAMLAQKFQNLERSRASDRSIAEAICGYHLEGPWLSPEPGYRGAHNPKALPAAEISAFARLQEAAGGNIRLLTIAPEIPGAVELIAAAAAMGVRVSLGHTNASNRDIDAAIDAGARFCTHLGNAVPLELPRHDNVIQRLLARDELTAFFIPDGIHLPPNVLRNFFRAKLAGKALFTTDCMAAAGAPPGRYTLGHIATEVGGDGVVYSPGTRHFAGSSLCPAAGVRNVEKWLGLPPTEARRLFSTAVAAAFDIALPAIK